MMSSLLKDLAEISMAVGSNDIKVPSLRSDTVFHIQKDDFLVKTVQYSKLF